MGIQQENLEDLKLQLNFLLQEEKKLGVELLEAKVRDLPEQMEEKAKTFNVALEEALKKMEALKSVWEKMRANQDDFKALSKEYFSACEKLQVVKPLELKIGFGALAHESSPLGMSFQLPDFLFLLGSLEAYRKKLASVAEFKKSNPNYQADIEKVQEHDRKSSEIPFSKEGFVKVFSLPES